MGNNPAWKKFERQVASFFGTLRMPLSGSNAGHGTTSDIRHNTLYVEAKRDKSYLGSKLLHLLHGVGVQAKREGRIPVVCLKEHGKQGFWIVVHSKYLEKVAAEQAGAGDGEEESV